MVNFSSGIVDWANPLTWPIVADLGEIPDLSVVADVFDTFIKAAKSVPILGPLAISAINAALMPLKLIAPSGIEMSLEGISRFIRKFGKETAGLAELQAYIGHSNVGVVPQILGSNIPALNFISGPPYPIIISNGGTITSFAAEYNALLSCNLSIIISSASGGIFANALTIYNFIAENVNDILKNLDAVRALGLPLPEIPLLNKVAQKGTLNMFATLWHQPGSSEGPAGSKWTEVAKVDLGAIDLAYCSFLDNLPDLLTGAGRSIGNLLGLDLADDSNQMTTSNYKAGVVPVTNRYKVSAGDYLLVQFGLDNPLDATIFAAVAAPYAGACVSIS